MKTLAKKLLAVAALLAVTLYASSMYAPGAGAQTGGGGHQYYRLVDLMGVEGFDTEWRDGGVVGLRALRQDGSWLDLRPKPGTPAPDEYCADPGQISSCWEDEEKQMSVCICVYFTTPTGPGPLAGSWKFAKKRAR